MGELIDDLMLGYYKYGTHQSLGKYFVNTYVKADNDLTKVIYCESDINKARVLISQFMSNNKWHKLPDELATTESTAPRFFCKIN